MKMVGKVESGRNKKGGGEKKRSLTLVRDDLEPFALYPSHGD